MWYLYVKPLWLSTGIKKLFGIVLIYFNTDNLVLYKKQKSVEFW